MKNMIWLLSLLGLTLFAVGCGGDENEGLNNSCTKNSDCGYSGACEQGRCESTAGGGGGW